VNALAAELPGSRAGACRDRVEGLPDPDSVHQIVFHLRPRPSSGGLGWVNREALLPPAQRRLITWRQYVEGYGAAPEDVGIVRAFAAANHLMVADVNASLRRVAASGSVRSLEQTFGIRLRVHGHGAREHLAHDGAVSVPPDIRTVTQAVLGLDGCTDLRWPWPAHARQDRDVATGASAVSAARSLLGLPDDVRGSGCNIAVLDLGANTDEGLGLQALVEAVTETAPLAQIVIRPGGHSVRDLVDCVVNVVNSDPAPAVLVIGWGAPEHEWSGAAIRTLEHVFLSAASMGIAIVCAQPADGQPWFPASSPHVIACAPRDRRGARSQRGESTIFPVPSWQEADSDAASVDGRQVPDIAVPVTTATGGRFADGPLEAIAAGRAAGLVAALAQAVDTRVGLVMPLLARWQSRQPGEGEGVDQPPLFDTLMSAVSSAVGGALEPGAESVGSRIDDGPSPLLVASREVGQT
jgi:hypothetical protein